MVLLVPIYPEGLVSLHSYHVTALLGDISGCSWCNLGPCKKAEDLNRCTKADDSPEALTVQWREHMQLTELSCRSVGYWPAEYMLRQMKVGDICT